GRPSVVQPTRGPGFAGWSAAEVQSGLPASGRGVAYACEREQFREACALVAPVEEQRLADQRVAPFAPIAQAGFERVDPRAPGRRRLQLALHVRMTDLLLRLGLDQVDRFARAHDEVGDVERGQAVVLDVA